MLCLETSADGAIGDICNAIGDNGSIVEKRHVCKHGHQPANAVEILREEHTGDDTVVAFGVLDLERILEHKARSRDGKGETQSDLQNGTQLRAALFAAGATARHTTTAALVSRPVVVKDSAAQPVRGGARTQHAVAAVDGIVNRRPNQLRVPQVGQTLSRLVDVHVLGRRHRCKLSWIAIAPETLVLPCFPFASTAALHLNTTSCEFCSDFSLPTGRRLIGTYQVVELVATY